MAAVAAPSVPDFVRGGGPYRPLVLDPAIIATTITLVNMSTANDTVAVMPATAGAPAALSPDGWTGDALTPSGREPTAEQLDKFNTLN